MADVARLCYLRPMNAGASSDYLSLIEEINSCTLCALSQGRTNAVPGEGNPQADIMFIGEAPGVNEDRQGRPFVGAAGTVLDNMLAVIGLDRSDVYICNMIKCRPPENRDPQPSEMDTCRPYLDRQIELIDPKVIVTLGRHSFGKFFAGETISKARGRPREWNGRIVFPVYHPAATLHNPRLKPVLEEDFRKLPSLIGANSPSETTETETQPEDQGTTPVTTQPSQTQLGMNFNSAGSDPAIPRETGAETPKQSSQGELF
jgi:uracil-DNA glycosylase family 4